MMLALQFSVACVDGPAQYAALGALNGPQDFVAHMVAEFDRRRRLMYSRLNEIEGFECCLPKGAFYVFPGVRKFGASSEEIASRLIKETGVATVRGSAFGKHGEGYLRLSYATTYNELEEALDRVEKAAKMLKTS